MTYSINLLPPAEKRKKEYDEMSRLVFALSARLGILIIFGMVLLLNAWFFLNILLRAQVGLINLKENDIRLQQISLAEEQIRESNRQLDQIVKSQQGAILWAPLLRELSVMMPSGVELNNLSYQASSNRLDISGWASSRDVLLKFQDSLQESGLFVSVDAPLSNLVKQYDVDFSFTLKPATSSQFENGK